MCEILFGLGHLGLPCQYLPTAFTELKHGPRHVQAHHAVVPRKERSAVLIDLLRKRADVGNIFGASRPQRGARFFELVSRSLDFGIMREGQSNGRFGVRRWVLSTVGSSKF